MCKLSVLFLEFPDKLGDSNERAQTTESPTRGHAYCSGGGERQPSSLPQRAGALVHFLQSLPHALWCASENHLRAQGNNCLVPGCVLQMPEITNAPNFEWTPFSWILLTSSPILVLIFIILHGLWLCLLFLQAARNSPYPLPSIPEMFNNKTPAVMMTIIVLFSRSLSETRVLSSVYILCFSCRL